eukprot:1926586-Amphidinium_carterae.1
MEPSAFIIRLHVDELLLIGKETFISQFRGHLKKDFSFGSCDFEDVMFCGQRIVKQGDCIVVHQDVAVDDLFGGIVPKGVPDDHKLDPEQHAEFRASSIG